MGAKNMPATEERGIDSATRREISEACMAGRSQEAEALLSRLEPAQAQSVALEELDSAAWIAGPGMVRSLLQFCSGREECGSALNQAVEMASRADAQSSDVHGEALLPGLLESIRLLLEAAPGGSAVAGAFRTAAHSGELDILQMFIEREGCKGGRGGALQSAAWASQQSCVRALLDCEGIPKEEIGIALCAALEQEDFDIEAPVTSTMFGGALEALEPEELARVSARARALGHLVGARRAEALIEARAIGDASSESAPKVREQPRGRL